MENIDFVPFGTQYYRHPTPLPDSWARDLRNIRAHGMNTVKFMVAWRWCCPAEGRYDFSDIDILMDLCRQNGLKAVLNSVFPGPAWLYQKYPDCLMETLSGEKLYPTAMAGASFGGEPGPCYSHEESLRHRLDFLRALVRRYADHPALLCWDVANEPELTTSLKREEHVEDLTCCCPVCTDRFRKWLEKKYKTIDNLNGIWMRRYTSFQEAEIPRNPGAYTDMIDWRLFMTDVLTEECRLRIEAAKEIDSRHPVMVHTVTMPFFPLATCGCDEYAIARYCDLFGNSVGSEPLSAAITLSAAPDKMVINSEIHAVGGDTYNRPIRNNLETMKRHIFKPMSMGIQGFLFWQYRPERLGLESPAWGLTDMKGNSTPWLDAVEKIARAVEQNSDILLHRKKHCQTAVLNSQKGQLFDFCVEPGGDLYIKSVRGAHAMLLASGYEADVIGDIQMTKEHLSRYQVLYDPLPYYKDAKTCALLQDWVKEGGTLISECFFGGYSSDDGLHTLEQPGFGCISLFGVEEEYVLPANKYSGADENTVPAGTGTGLRFYAHLLPRGGRVADRFRDGSPAVIINDFGRGHTIYIGSLWAAAYESGCAKNAAALSAYIRDVCGLLPIVQTGSPQVIARLLCGADSQMLVVDNQDSGAQVHVSSPLLEGKYLRNILTGDTVPLDKGKAILSVDPGSIDAFRAVP